eukprot:5438479-Pyramimonas_sp.AAC.1
MYVTVYGRWDPETSWRQPKGPISRFLRCLQRVNWGPKNYSDEWIDDRGAEISLLHTSPSLIKLLLRGAIQGQHERDMARVVGMQGESVR